ncbi:MurT ligase domain-containing protein [soil metagenome]
MRRVPFGCGEARTIAAMAINRVIGTAIRRSGRGGGTAFPGMVATRIAPDLLDRLAKRLPAGSVVVAGTNGKTTTTRMISDIFKRTGLNVAHNRTGSNLVRGIAGAFADQMPIAGRGPDIGVVEADENAFPEVVRRVQPRVVLLLNLFRDQLDRYGELESIAASWRPVIRALGSEVILCVNADDPRLARLAAESSARVVTFGMSTAETSLSEMPHAADAAYCPVCGARFEHAAIYLGHLGDWICRVCDASRPPLNLTVSEIAPDGFERQQLTIEGWPPDESFTLDLALPGVYNAYNVLAAASVACALGMPRDCVISAASSFRPAFGRLERVNLDGRQLILALAKNPTGFNEVLRMLVSTGFDGSAMIGINDLDADGRDVSWLWDVDFEVLAERNLPVIAAGIRGHDLALRMTYAGLDAGLLDGTVAGLPFARVVDHLLDTSKPGDRIFVLLTYTAMLQLRSVLAERGVVEQFWEE